MTRSLNQHQLGRPDRGAGDGAPHRLRHQTIDGPVEDEDRATDLADRRRVVELQVQQRSGEDAVMQACHIGRARERRLDDQSSDGMVRRRVDGDGAAERPAVHVEPPPIDAGTAHELGYAGVGGGVQGPLGRAAPAPAVAGVIQDQEGGSRRLELPHDGPDRRDVLAVAVEPQQGGPGRLGAVGRGRSKIPPRETRPVIHHDFDPLAVRDPQESRIRHCAARRRKRQAILEPPAEEHQDDVSQGDTRG